MKKRALIGNILVFLAAAFTVNLSAVMLHRINTVVLKEPSISLFRDELVACTVFLLFALDVRFGIFTRLKPLALKAVGWTMRIAVTLMTVALLFFAGKVTAGGLICNETTANNAIVLGMALENGKPTSELLSRLDTAMLFLQKNPEGKLILTGGTPDSSGRTEAEVMHEILAGRGVGENRMILEDQAKNTKANFRNSAKLIGAGEPVVLISSDFHMDRAVKTAQSAGFSEVQRMPAPSSLLYLGTDVMGEVVMALRELAFSSHPAPGRAG